MKHGLIGHPVGHSYSKKIHGLLGNKEYEILDVQPEKLSDFFEEKDFEGINVTLPYKEAVLPYLDVVDVHARGIGAVNTVVNRDGQLVGYNTDYYGFRALIGKHCDGNLKEQKVVILGTGGTSKTVRSVVKDMGAGEVYRVSRSKSGEDILSYEEAAGIGAEVIINTTPVGMYPNEKKHCIPQALREAYYRNAKLCVDVIYRPMQTPYIAEALERGIEAEGGLYMLVAQAVYASEVFMGLKYPENTIDETYQKMVREQLVISKSQLRGKIDAPPSKSYSHRQLIMGAHGKGMSLIEGTGRSDDIQATLDGLKKFGAKINVLSESDEQCVVGIDGSEFMQKNGEDIEIFCNESGSTLRFLLPMALRRTGKTIFFGKKRLFQRPMEVYEDICKEQGLYYKKEECSIEVCGPLRPGEFRVPGNISSQFISGLLFTLPYLDGDSTIELLPPLESVPYIQMTVDTLKEWGITVYWQDNRINVPGRQQVESRSALVEKDYSNGAYLGAFLATGHTVEVAGMTGNTLQGDRVFPELFAKLRAGSKESIPMEDTPDLVPIAMAIAACGNGGTFTGTRRLAMKESDRGQAMLKELSKFGISGKLEANTITVYPGELRRPQEVVWGHNDHRIVMALTLLLAQTGGKIQGYEAVNKSFPTFFAKLESCGLLYQKEYVIDDK